MPRRSDSAMGVVVAASVVVIAWCVLATIADHAKEHGHDLSPAGSNVERAQGAKCQSVPGPCHSGTVHAADPVRHVRGGEQ